jgi:nicotinamidase-related amidase
MSETCLILIDLQEGFRHPKWGKRNQPLLEENVGRLLALFRQHSLPVIHVRHDSTEAASPLRWELPGFAILACATPLRGEEIITKRAHGAFVGTALEELLRGKGIRRLVLAGLTTDHCVSTTMRMGFDLGFSPLLVADATATFERRFLDGSWADPETVHRLSLASLHGEFGGVIEMGSVRGVVGPCFH